MVKKICGLSALYLGVLFFLRLPFWQNIDTAISLFVIEHRTVMATNFFVIVTRFADSKVIVGALVIIAIIFFMKKEYWSIFRFVGISGACAALNTTIKLIVNRARPSFSQLLYESSSSFPSGHSSASFSFYGNLALYLYMKVEQKWLRGLIILFGTAMILIIGFSRIYLGVHWFSDILAGYATAGYSMLMFYFLTTKYVSSTPVSNKKRLE